MEQFPIIDNSGFHPGPRKVLRCGKERDLIRTVEHGARYATGSTRSRETSPRARCPRNGGTMPRPSGGPVGSGGVTSGGRRADARPAGAVRPRQRLPRAGGPQDWPGTAWSPLVTASVAELVDARAIGELVALTGCVGGGVEPGRWRRGGTARQ